MTWPWAVALAGSALFALGSILAFWARLHAERWRSVEQRLAWLEAKHGRKR